MRADRLVAALLVLQARGRVTASELADELEISERTARRDLEALAMAGIPVYSQRGRGGGWALLGGGRTDLSGLTAAEAETLFLVAGPASSATPEVKAALRKLVRALPDPMRASAQAAAAAVVLDPSSWDRNEPPPPPHLAVLRRAVVDGVQVELGYTDRDRADTHRTVHPLGLVAKGSVWYLVAGTDSGMRTFRVNRVRSVTPTEHPVARPDGFDLAETWKSIVDTLEERRAPVRVRALADRRLTGVLRGTFGTRLSHMAEHAPTADGRIEFEVRMHSEWTAAGELARFGGAIEVLEPAAVRNELARIGAELVRAYESPPPVPDPGPERDPDPDPEA
jgi:predicted DNA-binding transcriptional regulator YafY